MFRSFLFLLAISLATARYFETSIKFTLFGRNKGWVFVDKMTFAPGKAQVSFETSTSGLPYGRNSQLFLQAIPEQHWEKQALWRCNNSIRMPLAVHTLTLDGATTTSTFTFDVQDYSIYYFVLKDCQSRFLSQYENNNLSLNMKLHLVNNDKEVGEEEDHWYIVPFIVAAGMAVVHFYMKEFRMNSRNMEWSKMLLFVGTVAQVSSLFWKSVGFVIYHYTGADYFFFHFIYLMMHSVSESAIVVLVTLIGFGWTLTFNTGKYFDVFLPLVGCMGVINVILTMITKIGHDHDRHHVFDNIGGGIVLGYRLVVGLVFVCGCVYTYRKVRISLKKFMWKFGVLGLMYIISMPVVVLLANWNIEARNRNQFVFICIQVIKFTTNMVLTYQMNNKNSEYTKVNYQNSSFLPAEEAGFL